MALNLYEHSYEPGTYKSVYSLKENQYAGRVLSISRGETYQIMSDIWGTADWALVLDEENKPKRILMNVYDMGCPEHLATGEVDATEETIALYRDYLTQRNYERLLGDAKIASRQFEKGSIAKVVRGKFNKGAQGKVVVIMTAPYNMGYRSSMLQKLGIATSDVMYKKALPNGKVVDAHKDMVWAWAKNCQRMDEVQIDKDALLKQARERAMLEVIR